MQRIEAITLQDLDTHREKNVANYRESNDSTKVSTIRLGCVMPTSPMHKHIENCRRNRPSVVNVCKRVQHGQKKKHTVNWTVFCSWNSLHFRLGRGSSLEHWGVWTCSSLNVSSLAESHRNGCREKLVKEDRRGRKWEALNSPGGVSLCDAMSAVHLHLTESSRFDKVSSCFTCVGLRLKEAKRLAQDHRDNKKHM